MTTKELSFILLVLAAAQFTHIVDFMIVMPLGATFMRIFSISPQQFSFIVSAYTIAASVSSFCFAFLADRFDRKRLLFFVYAGFILGNVVCAISTTFYHLLLARILSGVFGGIISSLVLSIVSDLVPYKSRGKAMGVINTSFAIASIVGVPLGLFFATNISWHAPFWILSAISLVILGGIFYGIPSISSHLEGQKKPIDFTIVTSLVRDPAQRLAVIFIFILMFSHFVLIPILSPSMVYNVGFQESELTFIYLFGGIASIVMSPIIGWMADRWGKHSVFYVGIVFATIPIWLITNMGRWPMVAALSITTLFFISAGARMVPAMALVTGTVSPQKRGSFMSFIACTQSLGAGVASLFAGLIIVKDESRQILLHYPVLGYISIGIGLCSLLLARKIQAKE
ncbi:MAG: MFS transporter [Oligoflexia bacterium]|nr:MFS transporter [Oligoflexia bacterium]